MRNSPPKFNRVVGVVAGRADDVLDLADPDVAEADRVAVELQARSAAWRDGPCSAASRSQEVWPVSSKWFCTTTPLCSTVT